MTDATATLTVSEEGGAGAACGAGAGLVLIHASPRGTIPRAFVMSTTAVLIGREPPHGGWVIDQPAVSRVHAALQTDSRGTVRIRDMGSRNGVYVNGERVAEGPLRRGDVVRIGNVLFAFVDRDAGAHLADPLEPAAEPRGGLVGGPSIARIMDRVDALATTDATVLVSGETGTGKELVARALHSASGRRGALVAVNCAAIPAGLVEGELFGYERGAFTGAVRAHLGVFRRAQGGTLLLDEIGDMPVAAQSKLLRVLETREIVPLGTTRAVRVDVRVVCATHRVLPALVEADRFRGDLYARISQRIVRIPPLRERKEDLLPLVLHILSRLSGPRPSLGFGFVHRLALHDWPFNVRELASAVAQAVELAKGEELQAAHLPENIGTQRAASIAAPAVSNPPRRKGPSSGELCELLVRERGNVAAVARALGRDPAQVYRWLRQHKIRPDAYR